MYEYGFFSYESKADFLRRSEEFWNPDKTRFWQDAGVDLVIDRREGYCFWDMAGRRLIDLHLNGGTYNLGHRNPELIATLEQAMGRFDIGNHHFPALARTALAEALVATCPPNMQRVIYGSGGGEATDIAIKTARHTRQKRKIVSIRKGYHGHTGLAVATGDDRFSTLFLSDRPEEFAQVPFNDLDAMEEALKGGDVAGVVIETIPATYGFPLPEPGYLQAVKRLCEQLRSALHRRRGADRADAHGRDVGRRQGGDRAGHHDHRQGDHRRHVPDRLLRGERGVQRLAEGGRLRPHLHRRRRRARLRRGAEGARDLRPARGALDGPLHRRALPRRAARDPGAVSGLVRRHPPGRRGDGARVRPPAGRQARHAASSTSTACGRSSRRSTRACCSSSPASCSAPTWSTRCSTAPRVAIGQALADVGCRHDRPRPHDAPARPLGGHRVRGVRPRADAARGRGGGRGGVPKRGKIRGDGGRGDRHGRRRAQAPQERGVLARDRRALRGRRLRRHPGRRGRQDRRGAAAGRRRARADAVDEPDRHRLLQGPARADDAQRRRRLAAPAGAQGVRRGGAPAGRRPRRSPARPTAACRSWRSRRSR